jgi:hypothetical protein
MSATPTDVRSAAPAAAASAVIANAASLSGAVDLGSDRLHRIVIPAAWTAAGITFQASPDGTTYYDLYNVASDGTATEVTIASAGVVANRSLVLDPSVFLGIRWLKIRSGTSAVAVNQGAARTILLVTVPR